MSKIIDLRSDTVTKPCIEMRKVIMDTPVGDAYYMDDEITNELEQYCAKFFGTEEALFVITGTMANQIALRCNINSGDEVIVDKYSHILYYCASAATDLSGASFNTINTKNGIVTLEDVIFSDESRYRSGFTSSPTLIWIENTINHYAGKIYPLNELKKIYKFSKERGLKIHIDGARLLNACVSRNINPKDYICFSDTAMFSFSKALGAPAGSVLLGSKELIKQARKYQKWYGGGLHQSGILAAACLFAIKNNIHFIEKDHKRTKLFVHLITESLGDSIISFPVETNIIMLNVSKMNIKTDSAIDLLKKQGILVYKWNENILRLVVHKDINDEDVIKAANAIIKIFEPALKI